ncbi:MAG: hypothetical protein FJX67_11150 [Alphaproteobacteria bacterium]|nr:hypothetical protein [Alphaproteobacteria bacterium]
MGQHSRSLQETLEAADLAGSLLRPLTGHRFGEPVAGGVFCTQGLAANPDVECTPCYNRGITKLTNTKSTIINAINQITVLSAEQSSFTNLPQGLLWAWNVITPEAPFSEAEVDPPGNRIQAIVFLTDGENWSCPLEWCTSCG